jgi:hypothetical protein
LQLEANQQITTQQKNKYLSKMTGLKEDKSQLLIQEDSQFDWNVDSCLVCLEKYLADGGSFLGVVNEKEVFYEDPDFLEKILTSSNYNFEEKNCDDELRKFFQLNQSAVPKFFKIQKI